MTGPRNWSTASISSLACWATGADGCGFDLVEPQRSRTEREEVGDDSLYSGGGKDFCHSPTNLLKNLFEVGLDGSAQLAQWSAARRFHPMRLRDEFGAGIDVLR